MTDKLQQVLRLIDQANAVDPNIETTADRQIAKELLYSQRMSDKLSEFCPEASEHLQIAARAQHIERWTSPRSDYPAGRSGYKKWRSELLLFHAQRAAQLMAQANYSEDDQVRVQFLIQKRQMSRDPESQTLEDVVCLVFLEHYINRFAEKHAPEKLMDIIKKTWRKMSPQAQQAALTIDFRKDIFKLISAAIV
ncbi:MAG: DUF4202 domain-containing protein [Cellvibrionaceae bacterium]|nr:DUF4202 domain-containing protein [Cellvibrionaceae bacterium]